MTTTVILRARIASVFLTALFFSFAASFPAAAQTPPSGWTVSDVGNPSIPGYASESNGTYTVSGAGNGIGARSDAFTLLHRELSGDGTIVARVDGVNNGGSGAKAGLMIRQTLAAGSRHAFVYVTPSRQVGLQRRRFDDGGTSQVTTQASGTAPIWVRLERRGQTLTASWSLNGSAWTTLWTEEMTLDGATHVGLAVTSHNDAAAAIGTYRQLTVTGSSQPDTALPSGWNAGDVGSPLLPGSSGYDAGTFALSGAGAGVRSNADQFHFAYRGYTGDLDVVARVQTLSSTSSTAKAGVMIRDSLTANGAHAAMFVTRGQGTIFQRRRNAGGGTASTGGGALQAPTWLRLTISGTTVRAYQSVDGVSWILVGTDTLTLPTNYYVGLAITSHSDLVYATANVDNVTITAAGANQAPQISLTAPANGASYTAPATIAVAANASDSDGTIARVDFFRGTTLIGSDTTQPYSVTWNNAAAGSYTLTAVATDDDGATTTSGGVDITVTSSNSPPSTTLTSPANGATFTAPATIAVAANASDVNGNLARVDFYAGTTLIGSDTTSPYGVTWSNVPAGTYTVTATAVDSENASTTSAGHTVTVNAANQAPAVSLTAPANGATFTAPATIAIAANAGDGDGTIARVEFYAGSTLVGTDTTSPYGVTWNNVPAGSYSLTARAFDNGGASTTSAARSVTVGSNQVPAVALTAPANGATFTAPATVTISANASDTDGTIARVEFYAGTTLVGTDTTSPYSVTWSNVSAGTYSLTARAFDNAGGNAASAARSITVNGANQPPAVSLTAPANGAIYTAPANVTISASASDADGTVARVEFYSGSTLIGTDTTAPYSVTWSNVGAGAYSLTARAVDNTGAMTTSAARGITVNSPPSSPTAVFNPSPDHDALVTSYQFEVFAPGADPNTATPIRTQNLGKPPVVNGEISADISTTINALAPGNYQATVAAVGSGGVGRSAAVNFTK